MAKKIIKKITIETNIMEAVESNPKAINIFAEYGLPCIGCAAAQFESIGDIVAEFGIDGQELVDKLNGENKK